MRKPKVSVYLRIRLKSGRNKFAEPSRNRNRTLREGYAVVGAKAEHHPEGIYYLRYARVGKKREWEYVGRSADAAEVALRNKLHDLQAELLGRMESPEGHAVVVEAKPCKVFEAIREYLGRVSRLNRAPKTIAAYTNILARFGKSYGSEFLDDLKQKHLLTHMHGLRLAGLTDRTVFNHIAVVSSFLRVSGVSGLMSAHDKPKFDEKVITTYSDADLQRLFAACKPAERLLWEFFLCTGFRDREVSYCTWSNVDFDNKVIRTKSMASHGFRLKDHEQRAVPVPDHLLSLLSAWKARSSSIFIFATRKGLPDPHLLRKLKAIARRGLLNCGECINSKGESCASAPVCELWVLHKFRKTFATMHVEAGVSVRTVQGWLGHSDLETTLRYLAVADLRSARTRDQVNNSFATISAPEVSARVSAEK